MALEKRRFFFNFSFKQEPVNTDIIPLEEAYDSSRSKKLSHLNN